MAEVQSGEKKDSSLTLKNREKLILTGISDVISFDESSIYLVTGSGNLLIEGIGLHITALNVDSGELMAEGLVCVMAYNDKGGAGKKSGLFSKKLK